mmetsp:Transcript_30194/g.50836  ORF Transcript_30194/g.50836 Transcript_30194/m.50836 type:complete len:239 (+) Transcript_30194:1183-1899(+)
MILCTQVGLDALARKRGPLVHVAAALVRPHKRDCADVLVVAEGVHNAVRAVHHIQHARREPRLHGHLGEKHGRPRVLLGGLQDHRVSRGHAYGEHPKGNHRREVERANSSADPERLADGISVNACGHILHDVAHLVFGDPARRLHHLESAEHIHSRIGKGFALFQRNGRRQLVHIGPDEFLELKHDAHSRWGRSHAPLLERVFRALHCCIELLGRGARNPRHHVLCSRVDHINPLLRF